MTSAIIATDPVPTVPTTQSVRDNFAVAKSEISALQTATAAATDTTSGIVELATVAEVNTGTDTGRAVTPEGIEGWTGSAQVTTLGIIAAGTWEGDILAEAYLPDASDSAQGVVELADITETNAGTNNTKALTPLMLETSDLKVDVDSIVRVQSCVIDGTTAAVTFSPDSGWSAVRNSEGVYTVTFPTAASSATAQVIVGTQLTTVALASNRIVNILDLGTTTCVVRTFNAFDTVKDVTFSLMRTV